MPELHLASFACDVTPPEDHPLCGGWILPVRGVDDPLRALGVVLLGMGKPVVLCAVDWVGIRNEAFRTWRKALADAAHTTPEHTAIIVSLLVAASMSGSRDSPVREPASIRGNMPASISSPSVRPFSETLPLLPGPQSSMHESRSTSQSERHNAVAQASLHSLCFCSQLFLHALTVSGGAASWSASLQAAALSSVNVMPR